VAQFKYLGMTVTNQNLIHEEIKRRLNSVNTCYHSIQNLLCYHLLSKNIKIRIYETIILPMVLYGCETWSLTLREEHRLRRVYELGRDDVTGDWRTLHNEELHNFYSFPSIIRMIKPRRITWDGHVAQIRDKKKACNLLMGRQRYRWVDSIKMDLGEIGWCGMDWNDMAQNKDQWRAPVNTVMNI
jgi:hypothetical protein